MAMKQINSTKWLNRAVLTVLSLLLTACEKDEIAIEKHQIGDISTTAIVMEPDYRYQVYFDLGTGEEVMRNLKTSWDLGFEASNEGNHIILNTAKGMQLMHTGDMDFDAVTEIPNALWRYDTPEGDLNETAFGDWADFSSDTPLSKMQVYVLDRGYDHLGYELGMKKIQILSLNNLGYQIKYANLDGTEEGSYTLEKDSDYNFSFFSFEGGGSKVIVQPPKKDWDLVFSQYTHIFDSDEEISFYLVTGVLQNRHKTKAYLDTEIGFPDFNYNAIEELNLKSAINTIGYTWKNYNYDAGTYTIYSDLNYIIQDHEGFFYKLHFIDFYDENGKKGTPTFEYRPL